jgi:hypothetical protein
VADEWLGVFCLTSAPNTSLAGKASARANHDGAVWNAALAAASGGTLSTGGLRRRYWFQGQQGPGQFMPWKIYMYFNALDFQRVPASSRWSKSFLPGGKICRFGFRGAGRLIASGYLGLY